MFSLPIPLNPRREIGLNELALLLLEQQDISWGFSKAKHKTKDWDQEKIFNDPGEGKDFKTVKKGLPTQSEPYLTKPQ